MEWVLILFDFFDVFGFVEDGDVIRDGDGDKILVVEFLR